MYRRFIWLAVLLFLLATCVRANDETKGEDRLRDAGSVMKAILNVRDGVPHDILGKADCVIVFPSVRKAAFGIGAGYDRGTMACHKAPNLPVIGERR